MQKTNATKKVEKKDEMMDYMILKSLLTAVILGFAIGLQRTMQQIYSSEKEAGSISIAGSRTFALISLSGFLSGWLAKFIPQIIILVALSVVLLLAISYYVKTTQFKKMGMTTQVAAIVTYLLGLMIAFHLDRYAIFTGVLMIVLLEIKPRLKRIEHNISPSDLNASILLLAMTFLVLPMLPDRMIDPYHLFNPYKTWLMAVIIAAISFVGYVAIKILGNKRGVLLTGLFGGLISSTAVSISLSKMYLEQKEFLNNFAAGIAMASTLMYLRVLLEAFVIDINVAKALFFPYIAASLSGLAYVYILYRHSHTGVIDMKNSEVSKNPLQLSEAIKFGLLFGIIYGAITLVQDHYGEIGVYIISLLSGITDVDAITLSLSELSSDQKLSVTVSSVGIVIASATNSFVKLGIVFWIGGKALGWKLTIFYLLTLSMLGGAIWIEQSYL